MSLDALRRAWRSARDAESRDAYAEALAQARTEPGFGDWVRSRMLPGEPLSDRRAKLHMLHGVWWDWEQPGHPGFRPAVRVRPEVPGDHVTVDRVVGEAFGQLGEVRLVRALRGEPGVISLVALLDEELVGHCMLSPVHAPMRACALAPVAVATAQQRRGVGGALVEAALRTAWVDHSACFVLGSPLYYGAWFEQAPPRWTCPWPAPADAFRVAFPRPDFASGLRDGPITYPLAFAAV